MHVICPLQAAPAPSVGPQVSLYHSVYCSVWKSISACLPSAVGQFCIALQHRSLCFTQDTPTGKLALIDMLHPVQQDMVESRERVLDHWCYKIFQKGAVTACQHKSRPAQYIVTKCHVILLPIALKCPNSQHNSKHCGLTQCFILEVKMSQNLSIYDNSALFIV